MALTLADLIDETSFELDCAVGHEHLARTISIVHVAEIHDPTPWLREKVFLLTTGLVDRSSAEIDEFFRTLANAGVSGVGFGVGVGDKDVPSEWVQRAKQYEIPILRVPLTTPYIAIAEFVRQHHTEAQFAQVQRMINAQQRLAHSKLSQGTQRDTLEALARELNATVYWRNPDGFEYTDHRKLVLDPQQEEILSREISHHIASQHASSTSSQGDVFVHIARTAGVPIAVVRKERYTPLEQGIIGTIAAFLDLSPAQESDHRIEDAVGERILSAVLDEEMKSVEDILPLFIPGSNTCVMVCLATESAESELFNHEPDVEDNLRAFLARDSRVSRAGYSTLMTRTSRGIGIVVDAKDVEFAKSIMQRFFTMFERQLDGWRAGISEVGVPSKIVQLYAQALQAQQVDEGNSRLNRVTTFTETRGTAVMREAELLGVTMPVFDAWHRQMSNVSNNEAQRALTALHAFLMCNGVIERAAVLAGVHRQTLQARLKKAESILEVSLESPTDRALLWIAFTKGTFDLK